MCMTADELDARMSDEEFREHMADCSLLECERERDDLRTAALMTTIANSQGGKLTTDAALDILRIERVKDEPKAGPVGMSDEAMMAVFKIYPHTVQDG